MYDIYLPIVVLAPALIYFLSPEIDATTTVIIGGTIFASTLVARPVGAVIFGHYADTLGRKRTTIIAVSGFGILSVLMAALPGYEQWGLVAVSLLIALRFIDGIFVGGAYTAANPLAMEYCPKQKRGLYGAVVMTGFPLGYAAIAVITLLTLSVVPAGDINSPYVQWGWRIPFLFGALLALALVIYYYYFVDESEMFEAKGGGGSPLRELFSGENFRNFLQVFVLMTGFWLTVQALAAMLPGVLGSHVGLSETNVTITLIIAFLILALGYMGAGVLSQRIGRRPFLAFFGLVSTVGGGAFYYLLISAAPESLFTVIVLVSIIGLLTVSCWGLATSYINERFQTSIRASGFGIGYSLSVIIPSFYAYYQVGLGTIMPFEYTVIPLVVLGSVLIFVGAVLGPETRDVDFTEEIDAKGESKKSAVESTPGTDGRRGDGE